MSSSVESDESYSCNFNILKPSTSKSTQKSLGARDSFTISLLPGSKSHKEISDLAKKIIVGEAYADLRAQQETDKISSEDHIILAISICKSVPQLSDIPPPGSKCTSEDFIYWGTVHKLLREFHRKERAANQARKEDMGRKRK